MSLIINFENVEILAVLITLNYFFSGPKSSASGHVQCNLLSDFQDMTVLPPPSPKDTVRVYLRVKPKTAEETELTSGDEDPEAEEAQMVNIESEYQVALNAPKESNTYKNSMNGAGNMLHR